MNLSKDQIVPMDHQNGMLSLSVSVQKSNVE